jgi:putative metallopeptidase
MATVYDKAPLVVQTTVLEVLHQHHGDLESAGVTLNILFAYQYDKDGEALPAMKVRGHQALAKISITSLPDRVRGLPDAKLVFDREFGWVRLSDSRRQALIDHELTHLMLVFDAEGDLKLDDCNRPKLKLRHHDWELTGFDAVAKRHGEAAVEIHEIIRWQEEYGQACLFPIQGVIETRTRIIDGKSESQTKTL